MLPYVTAMNTAIFSSEHKSDNTKVPCIVVEDLDSTSHISSSYGHGEMYPHEQSVESKFCERAVYG